MYEDNTWNGFPLYFIATDHIAIISHWMEGVCQLFLATTKNNNLSYPDSSPNRSDDEPPGWFGLGLRIARFSVLLPVLLSTLLLSVLQLLLWRVEGVGELYVSLV